jgi:hypothetical protein
MGMNKKLQERMKGQCNAFDLIMLALTAAQIQKIHAWLLCCHMQLTVCPLESRKVTISITYGLLKSRKVAISICLSVGVNKVSRQPQTPRFLGPGSFCILRSPVLIAKKHDSALSKPTSPRVEPIVNHLLCGGSKAR